MKSPKHIPLTGYIEYPVEEMKKRSSEFYENVKRRRTVRHFSDRPVSVEIIENCIRAAGTAPSGANQQPWHFVAVSDPEIKKKIRIAAEEEERKFYSGRAPKEWLYALTPLGTDEHKPFLETAPWLIVVFEQRTGISKDGGKIKHYYANESTGIASGILITALHNAGLGILTHTPSPMSFLSKILNRPPNERAFLLVVAGYPVKNAVVPDISKKSLEDIATFL
jgi:nitroreductase